MKQEDKKIILQLIGFTVLNLIIWIYVFSPKEDTATASKKDLIYWYENISPLECEDELKGMIRDPKSYSRDGDMRVKTDNTLRKELYWSFRAKNGFGGYNQGYAKCVVSRDNKSTIVDMQE